MKPGSPTADQCWTPSGQREWPWHPEWTVYAACRGKYGRPQHDRDERYDEFFDFAAQSDETKRAKAICYSCPVRLTCLKENLYVPFGIFGGYTERERRALRREYRDRSVQIGFFRHGMETQAG
jgi:WhiB family redox-sensing transcriptional regulator